MGRAYWVGPAFLVIALLSPSVFLGLEPVSFAQLPGWTGVQTLLWNSESFGLQRALLSLGLSLGVIAAALAVYHRDLVRRLLHLSLLLCLLELFYRLAYRGPVSPGLLLSVGETSARETLELLVGHPFLTAGLSLFALAAAYALSRSWRIPVRFSSKNCLMLAAVSFTMISASSAFGLLQLGNARMTAQLLSAEVRTTFPFDIASAVGYVAVDWIDSWRRAKARAAFEFPNGRLLDAAARDGQSELYVIVIGETSRRANWSLYGYPRPTTPLLEGIRAELFSFDRVTSNATTTILSLPLALTRAAPGTRALARSEKSIISLLKQAGFETFWVSNQERSPALTNSISQIAAEADHVSFPEDIPADAQEGRFDSNLLTRLDDVLGHLRKGDKTVLFLHMEGSHFGYSKRYPAGFGRFDSIHGAADAAVGERLRLVDQYDNSILFTDHNLRGVIDRMVANGGKSGLIFFSDHGERLFDNGLNDSEFGHGFPSVSLKEIEVPFFIWLSPDYRRANPLRVTRLENNRHSVVQLHNLFETVVDLAGVDYAGRAAPLSLFSDAFAQTDTLDVLNIAEQAVVLPAYSTQPMPRPTLARHQ